MGQSRDGVNLQPPVVGVEHVHSRDRDVRAVTRNPEVLPEVPTRRLGVGLRRSFRADRLEDEVAALRGSELCALLDGRKICLRGADVNSEGASSIPAGY